eukprot:CAMPEP_0170174086 /NCGR_PEP_ID=MMETSP0040_2-20121228/7333_1 /TAXON_ID=641309 /ORGANISM="Lotharella oceanica, Strain CCMP622" /LENGTH=325 /DNA_ID=CAMNT_0010415577 /DNA_START=50 /DNA_END=1027 /DNA_ORIENTATION=-
MMILSLFVAVATADDSHYVSNHMFRFVSFMKRYNKTFDRSEFASRYEIFRNNVNFIRKHNSEGHSYTLAINEYADMTWKEFHAAKYGSVMPKRPYITSQNAPEETSVAAPSSVDWTSQGAVTPVKNQGQCGSCWSFSATGALESANYIQNGKLESYSEQQLVDCARKYGNAGCNGGLMDSAFEYVIANGICSESDYPYTARDGSCRSSCNPLLKSVSGYKDVRSADESGLKTAVAKQPVSVAIEADKPVFQFYSGGVLTGSGCGTQLDHGVLVVGYGTMGGTDYWKVKNSWGASWGTKGYILIERGAGGRGVCGIASQPSYPVVA